jgi:hypothetical protein
MSTRPCRLSSAISRPGRSFAKDDRLGYRRKFLRHEWNRLVNRFVWSAVLLLVLSGCSTLSPRAARIQLHTGDTTQTSGCTRLGSVTAKEGGWHSSPAAMVQGAKDSLRETTAIQYPEADTVVMADMDKRLTSVTANGVAFKCF